MKRGKLKTSVSTFNVPDISLVPWEDYDKFSTLKEENKESIETIRKKMEKDLTPVTSRFN
ncbi:MAG: hypothetical protein JWM92_545 [Candidatus Nomurabacteria bacterium]|jgi:hypothetical protein|nr:hypothetical protein [Candidatus Nomurabacteria bacterium]